MDIKSEEVENKDDIMKVGSKMLELNESVKKKIKKWIFCKYIYVIALENIEIFCHNFDITSYIFKCMIDWSCFLKSRWRKIRLIFSHILRPLNLNNNDTLSKNNPCAHSII